jgi:hypothetical protein
MPRELSTEVEAASEAKKLTPIALVQLDFDSGIFRMWSGWGPLVWGTTEVLSSYQRIIPGGIGIDETTDDETLIPGSFGIDQDAFSSSDNIWYGAGNLGTIGAISETTEIKAVGMELMLSGIPTEVLDIALLEDWQNRPAYVYLGVLDPVTGQIDGEPVLLFYGRMDRMVLSEGEQAAIVLSCESEMIDLERIHGLRYTPDSLRAKFPGDAFCDAVAAIQEVDIHWGTA